VSAPSPRSEAGPAEIHAEAIRTELAQDEVSVGYSAEKVRHLKRLRRIEGQLRGLQRMVGEDQYCIDVLTQVSAATRALQAFSLELIDQHMRSCLREAAVRGGPEADEKVDEASAAIARLVRS
jgi:DNA-binding FrmR family transcriptional regulator